MKRLIQMTVITCVIALTCWAAFSRSAPRAQSAPLFEETLRAHGGREAIASITASRIDAVRLTSTLPPDFFERRLRIETADGKFRRRIVDPLGLRTQFELFDGQAGFFLVSGSRNGQEPPPALNAMSEGRLRSVKFSVETRGLLPLLQQFAVPGAEVISQEVVSPRLNRFRIRTSAGLWNVYTDDSHLIRKVEMGDKALQFADYRSVGGLRLPFIERLSFNQRLVQEMVFTTIELNPVWPADHFTAEALAREAIR